MVLALGVWACADAPAATVPVTVEEAPEAPTLEAEVVTKDTACAEPAEGMRRMRVEVGHSTEHLASGDVVDLLLVAKEVIPGHPIGGIPILKEGEEPDDTKPVEFESDHEEVVVRPLLQKVSVACASAGAVEVMLPFEDASFLVSTMVAGKQIFALERVALPEREDHDIYGSTDHARSDWVLSEYVPFVRRSKRCATHFVVPSRDYVTSGDEPVDVTTDPYMALYPMPVADAERRFAPGQRVDVLHGAYVPPHDAKAASRAPVPAGIPFAQGALVHSVTSGSVVLYIPIHEALGFVSRRGLGTWTVLGRARGDEGVVEGLRPRLSGHLERRAEAERKSED